MVKKTKKKQKKEVKEETNKEVVKTTFSKGNIFTENSNEARELYNKSRFGALLDNGKVQLSLLETVYLLEKDKIEVFDGKNKKLKFEEALKRSQRLDPNFRVRYAVFKNMRDRGYIIKTALKFGADFRVYDRGVKPGEDHAKWVVYPVHEGSSLTWYEFAAKNRVAHSTRKKLLIGVVDDEGDVSYWESRWLRP